MAGLEWFEKSARCDGDKRVLAKTKEKVYNTLVRPAMLFDLESVPLWKRQEEELEVAGMHPDDWTPTVTVIRMDKIRNEYIRGTAHVGV